MPVRRTRRKIKGGAAWWDKTKDFFKKSKLLSTVGRTLAPMVPGAWGTLANKAVDYAASQGYGRRRRVIRRGGALRPVGARRMGGMIAPVGGMKIKKSGMMSPLMMRRAMPKRMAMRF